MTTGQASASGESFRDTCARLNREIPIWDLLADRYGHPQRGDRGPCPFHKGTSESLSLIADANKVRCHSECQTTFSVLDTVMALEPCKLADAVRILEGNGSNASRPAPKPAPRVAQAGEPSKNPRAWHGDATIDALAAKTGLPSGFLRSLGLMEDAHLIDGKSFTRVKIPYRLADGKTARPRYRVRMADGPDGRRFFWGWPKEAPKVPYGLERLEAARKAGFCLMVEGESDCWVCWKHEIPALGLPGADMAGLLEAGHMDGVATVYVSQEPDKAGGEFPGAVAARLSALGWAGTVRALRWPDGTKDPAALHVADPASFPQRIREILASAAELPVERTPEGKPVVKYVQNAEKVTQLFDRILGVIGRTLRFFGRLGRVVFVSPGRGTKQVTERNVNGLLSSYFDLAVYELRAVCDGERTERFKHYSLLPPTTASAFAHSPNVCDALPPLNVCTRSPLFDTKWNLIATPGYHAASGIYYDGPSIVPVESFETWTRLLFDFAWRSEADRTNYVGMLLTALTVLNWPKHPFAVFNANRSQVGKTELAKIAAVVIDGYKPRPIGYTPDDTEFEKNIAQQVDAGDRVILIDNAKVGRHAGMAHVCEVNSPVLERSITSSVLNFRRLMRNDDPIVRPNDALFCLTMNYTRLVEDLRNRSVPINLHFDGDPLKRRFSISDPEGFALENRERLLAELAGMVTKRLRVRNVELTNPARHTVNRDWAEAIDAILRVNDLHGFLTNFEEAKHEFDRDYQAVRAIAEALGELPPAPAGKWAEAILREDLLASLKDHRGQPLSLRKQATKVGSLFSAYVGEMFATSSGELRLVGAADAHLNTRVYYFAPTEREAVK